jgi:ABC-type uncharacterized transport system permease subunit
MYTISALIGFSLYLAATVFTVMRLKRLARGEATEKTLILMFWAIAMMLHGVLLYHQIVTPRGLNLHFFNALSMVSILVAGLLFAVTVNKPLENLAIIVLPVAAITLALDQVIRNDAAISVPGNSEVVPGNSGVELHALISLLAFSLLSIAALQAILLAIQNRHLHNRHPGGLIRALPPLQLMEQLLFQLIAVGFILLSLALLSGFLFLEDIFAQHLVQKTILSVAAWLVFAVLLWGRWRFGWRGRTAIRWTLGGGFFLMLAYFGSKLVLELLLNRQ